MNFFIDILNGSCILGLGLVLVLVLVHGSHNTY